MAEAKNIKPGEEWSQWDPGTVIQQIQYAKQVRGIKDDILRNGFQPVAEHLPDMEMNPEREAGIPLSYVATKLGKKYDLEILGGFVVKLLEPMLLHKDIEPNNLEAQTVTRVDTQWLVMSRTCADELTRNLKSGRSMSVGSTQSLQ